MRPPKLGVGGEPRCKVVLHLPERHRKLLILWMRQVAERARNPLVAELAAYVADQAEQTRLMRRGDRYTATRDGEQ